MAASRRHLLISPLCALSLLALPCLAQAQDPATDPSAGSPRTAARSRPKLAPEERWTERLLSLPGGVVLRTEARRVDGRWERRDKRDRRQVDPIPQGAVLGQRTLDSALDELRERRREQRLAAAGERVPLAAWMLQTGLYAEALAELDRAFDEDPDCAAARELLASEQLPLGLPRADLDSVAGLNVLLDYGSRSTASLQELVVLRLEHTPLSAQRELLPLLERGLVDNNPVRREFSARALRRLFPGLAVPALTRRSVLDQSSDVRREAALALGDAGDEAVIDPLCRALESRNSIVRTHAAEALGLAGFAAAVEPLSLRLATLAPGGGGGSLAPRGTIFVGRQISYIQGYEAEVATNAAIADPLIGVVQEGVTLDARVFGVSGSSGYEYTHETRSIRRALGGLTGSKVTDTNAAWKRWWRTQGTAWLTERRGTGELAALAEELPGDG